MGALHFSMRRGERRALALTAALAAAVVCECAVFPRMARAEPPPPAFDDQGQLRAPGPPSPAPRVLLPGEELSAFRYVTPQNKHYLRGALEVLTVLIVGQVDYLLNTQARGGTLQPGDVRWGLRYDWPTFRSKLVFEDYHLDTNHFNTNFVSHPLAGTLYYTAARSNHLSIAESFGYAVVGAFTWEYFGELREEVSINDVTVTPVAGIAIGETSMQLSSFFRRSKKNAGNDLLAVFFSPVKAVNDFADGAAPLRSSDLDAHGLTNEVFHELDLYAGGGVTAQRSAGPSGAMHTYGDVNVGLDTRLVNLPGYGGVGKRSDAFDDGNVSHLHFDATISNGRLAGALLATELMPAGYYYRRAALDPSGRLRGEGLLVGLRAAFEYGVHDYNRDGARPIDLYTMVSPLGITAEYTHELGALRLRTRVDVGGELAGVKSYAYGPYARTHADLTNVQTVLQQEGYYYPLGVTAIPSVDLRYGAFELGGRVRVDSYQGIEGVDHVQERIKTEIPLADRVVQLRAWTAVTVPKTVLRLAISGEHRERTGSVGEVKTSQSESSLSGQVGMRF